MDAAINQHIDDKSLVWFEEELRLLTSGGVCLSFVVHVFFPRFFQYNKSIIILWKVLRVFGDLQKVFELEDVKQADWPEQHLWDELERSAGSVQRCTVLSFCFYRLLNVNVCYDECTCRILIMKAYSQSHSLVIFPPERYAAAICFYQGSQIAKARGAVFKSGRASIR